MIRLGLVGIGKIARDQHLPAIHADDRYELVATASRHARVDDVPGHADIMAMIAGDDQSIFYDKPYFGFGGGIRTRNENLIFGTVELRFIYYPRTTEDISSINIRVTSNLRIKYSGTFVRAPGFVR